jgi:hypothetical protein
MANQENNENRLNIELTEELAEGKYSNLAIITHSFSEFVLDFVRVVPGVPKAKVQSRVILNPFHAKRLMAALNDNIAKYEKANGPIPGNPGQGQEDIHFPMNFGGPATEA